MDKKSLIHGYLLDKKGGGEQISWDCINKSYNKQVKWLHFDYVSIKSRKWIKKESGIESSIVIESLLDEDSRPSSMIYKQGIFLSLRGVNCNVGSEPEDMVSIRVWIDDEKIVTTAHRQSLAVSDICNAIEEGKGPKNQEEFILMLNKLLSKYIESVIDKIENNMDELEEKVLDHIELNVLIRHISELRRETIGIKRYLLPQREALYNLQISTDDIISQDFRTNLSELRNKTVLFIENLESLRDRLSIIHEEIASNISMNINNKMYMLSLVSIIFLPMMFITSLLGINVGGIPGGENKLGFLICCLILLALSGVTLLVLKITKWI